MSQQPVPQDRATLAGPRLELPRFQFAPSARPAIAATPRHTFAPSAAPTLTYAPAAQRAPAQVYQATATALLQPQQVAYGAPALQHTPAPTLQHAPAPVAAPAAPMHAALQHSPTRPASISWDRLEPDADRTLLQRISPVHMGVLMLMVMIAMIATAGPATMTAKPTRLPALVSGGGTDVMLQPRAGATAIAAATPANAAASTTPRAAAASAARAPARARSRTKMIVVGSARLNPRVQSGGIPSPAAAANLSIAGGGRIAAADSGSIRMAGIPSPAASAQMGPETLPMRPSDGVTLPRMTGERDSHAVDRHYGVSTLPMEEPALPAMTPGAAAAQAERQVIINSHLGGRPSLSGGALQL